MSGFNIDISGDLGDFDKLSKEVQEVVDNELNSFGLKTVATAKSLCAVDEGFLRNSITFDKQPLSVEIIVAADYAAYVEFGTRGFAAAYVAGLPANWQAFAASFRGGGGGSFAEMLRRITEWVHRKGITGTYSVKTRKRTGNKEAIKSEDKSVAYVIALSILRKGIKPHPFLFPAIENNLPELKNNLKTQLNA